MNNLFFYVSILLIASLLIWRLISSLKKFLPQNQTISPVLLGVVIIIFLASILGFSKVTGVIQVDDFRDDIRFYDYASHYWGEEVVKVNYPPKKSTVYFYGEIATIECKEHTLEPKIDSILIGEEYVHETSTFYPSDSIVTVGDNGDEYHKYYFDDQKNLKKMTVLDSGHLYCYKYSYDESNKLIRYDRYQEDTLSEVTTRTYGKNLFEDRSVTPNGVFIDSNKFITDGRKIKVRENIAIDEERNELLPYWTIYMEYDGSEHIEKYERDGTTRKTTYENGVVKTNIPDWEGQDGDKWYVKNKFDEKGNWIERMIFKNGIPAWLESRMITYRDGTTSGQLAKEGTVIQL